MLLQYFLIIAILIASSNAGETHFSAAHSLSKRASGVVEKVSLPMPVSTIPLREKYDIDAVIDYDHHYVTVEETIVYPNHTGRQLDSLTLAIAANLWPNCFSLANVSVDGAEITGYALNAHRLDIPLPTPLVPDSVSNIKVRYSLFLPYMVQANSQPGR